MPRAAALGALARCSRLAEAKPARSCDADARTTQREGETKMLKRLVRFEMLVALLMAVAVGSVAFVVGRALPRAHD